MKSTIKRIGLITSGGDCPGLNALIRTVVQSAAQKNIDVIGLPHGIPGLIQDHPQALALDASYASAQMIQRGGSRLGGFIRKIYAPLDALTEQEIAERVVSSLKVLGIDGLIATGGDGSFAIISGILQHTDVPFVGIPKTIDNDVPGTVYALGFQSAVSNAADALMKVADTAETHQRIIVVETMGREAGFLPLHAGLAAGADAILLPEIPYDANDFITHIRTIYAAQKYAVVVVSESAKLPAGEVSSINTPDGQARFGGSGEKFAHYIHACTGINTRHCVLGHIQRGGAPNAFDSVLAASFGTQAVKSLCVHQKNVFVSWNGYSVDVKDFTSITGQIKRVLPTTLELRAANSLGIYCGTTIESTAQER
ncbi:MAG: 6-phosphofructokinase [Alphaproteobacteria bacterium]|nr:MAG: 6-phosphofructokinase [Alphaproteobacteria bacterium]